MGTGFDVEPVTSDRLSETVGIIPRAVHYLFSQIERKRGDAIEANKPPPDFKVTAQFVELYNEEVFDLIDSEVKNMQDKPSRGDLTSRPVSSPSSEIELSGGGGKASGSNRRPQTTGSIKIHEHPTGGIYIVGVGNKLVKSAEDTMLCLRNGALCRTTASTNMNDQSSRSHAIFTLHITQQRVVSGDEPESQSEFETLTAKFHFVDLAGSERLKRTGAVGDRAKEGISINCGLLALGNVISALGDSSKKALHVPYRDSKLTRLLQDSLGGNSKTVMIACVSPCDRDFVETLNTLKYANRARNIKNKVTINQDKSSRTIAVLRQEIQALQNELLEYKQGKRVGSGDDTTSDAWRENTMLHSEITNLRNRVKAMQETIDQLTAKNVELLAERDLAHLNGADPADSSNSDIKTLVKGYMQEIEDLRAKLCEAEATCETMRKACNSPSKLPKSPRVAYDDNINELIEEAKREVEKEQECAKKYQNNLHNSDEGSNSLDEDEEEEDDNENFEPNMAAEIELANVTNEISVKLRLIEQLEASQKRMEAMRAQYEEKLMCLMHKIKATELERDKVLSTIKGENKTKQVKEEYELKITAMNQEVKKLQALQKEHTRVLKNQSQYEKQINTLKVELESMKRTKVKLMNQVKEDAIRWREKETQRLKEINQLKKDQRKKEIAIRALEGEARMKDIVLKRKHEEINALKKVKTMSAKASGKVAPKFSPVKAKQKWSRISGSITKNVMSKQTLASFETEMESLMEERTNLTKDLQNLLSEKKRMQGVMANPADLGIINEDIEGIQAKLAYVDSKTKELQTSIVEITSAREEDPVDITSMVTSMTKPELNYVFSKMYEQNVAAMLEATYSSKKEVESVERLRQTERELSLTRDLLQHIMVTHRDGIMLPPEIAAKFEGLKTYAPESLRGSTESLSISEINDNLTKSSSLSRNERKARRHAATPSELLMGSSTSSTGSQPAQNDTFVVDETPDILGPEEFRRVNSLRGSSRSRRNTYVLPSKSDVQPESPFLLNLPNNGSASYNAEYGRPTSTNSFNKKPLIQAGAVSRIKGSSSNGNSSERFSRDRSPEPDRTESPINTPPGSPNSQRRANNDNNVFQRLFQSSSSGSTSENGGTGVIRNIRNSSANRGVLVNVSVAEGHTQSVLSLYATDRRLYSASKDSTAKIWDLHVGTEIQTLTGHPNNVQCVRVTQDNDLIITSSSYYIKMWDIRQSNPCVATLLSSGGRADDSHKVDPHSRILSLPPNEFNVTCIAVAPNDFYTSYNDRVRRWDMRAMRSPGLLPGRHGSAVTCMLMDNNVFISGSKDHTIKVYENQYAVHDPSVVTTVATSLEPPHYDGIEALAKSDDTLFSGSRDTCIKRWSVSRKELAYSMNNAHGNWITGLAFAPKNNTLLLSSGRDGVMKLWAAEDGREICKVDAHKRGVTCIATNSDLIFTGCQDGQVGIWKCRKSPESSPDNSDISP